MGVIQGDENGKFRPRDSLTRAEFCKMIVILMGKGEETARYRYRTIFPDVYANHWAAEYINYAASGIGGSTTVYIDSSSNSDDGTTTSHSRVETGGNGAIIHGQPDGTFAPDRAISFAEAVTIIMRVIGYDDSNVASVWPQGYLDLAKAKELTKGVTLSANDVINRAQAASLFVNALTTEYANSKQEYVTTLGVVSGEVRLLSVDYSTGKLRTTEPSTAASHYQSIESGKNESGSLQVQSQSETTYLSSYRTEYDINQSADFSEFIGLKGRVVTKNGKVLTFLPSTTTSGRIAPDAAVIVASNGSTAGFDALTGYTKGYTIYRNGVKIDARELRQYDVATYSAASNAVLVCDTRVQVYYESCQPSPSAPLSVTVLGGTTLSVLPTAQQSVAAFKPGQVMLLLLTADGRVGGAISTDEYGVNGNALCYVDGSGKVTMFCGTSLLPIAHTDADMAGQVVRISQTKPLPTDKSDCVVLSRQHNTGRGVLDVIEGKLGGTKVATDALILKDGVLTSLSELNVNRVEPRQIAYSRINSAGEVDLIVLGDTSTETIGRVVIWSEVEGERENRKTIDYMSLQYPGGETKPSRFVYSAQTGDFGVTQINSQDNFYNFTLLRKLSKVGSSAWVGTGALNYNGQTYPVATDVMCYNRDSGRWFSSLTEALDYGGTLNAYVLDGVVRAIDVGT